MGLQSVLFPNPLHGSGADLLARRHGPNTPVSGILRGSLHRRVHNGFFPFCGDLLGASATRPVLCTKNTQRKTMERNSKRPQRRYDRANPTRAWPVWAGFSNSSAIFPLPPNWIQMQRFTKVLS